MVNKKEMVIVSETHWDREWYLPFQEFRARLVKLVDKLLKILEKIPEFTNFTFDGQTIVLEDYLEVRPEKEHLLKKYITAGRISVGPWYVLPDEFLVSGEALIRNLMLGHKLARKFGAVMKAGYIPDPFGHIAQLPQIMRGFDIDSILFMRGMDDSFKKLELNLEFEWFSPGKVTSVLAIYLKYGYSSLKVLPVTKVGGIYKKALRMIRRLQKSLLQHSATDILLLNNGGDHDEVQAELPEIITQWNNTPELNEFKLVQGNFEDFIRKVQQQQPELKTFEGELRGARYHYLLSGTFSARMWIKQANAECQMLLERWAEPFATFAWILGEPYPIDYLWTGWKWLLRNHPHDSICGCSIDEVHQDMQPRFRWAKQIAEEITKESLFAIYNRIQLNSLKKGVLPLLVFNPLPWNRTDIASIDITAPGKSSEEFQFAYELRDSLGKVIPYQLKRITDKPRFTTFNSSCYRLSFVAKNVPGCGYEVYSLVPEYAYYQQQSSPSSQKIENEFYEIEGHPDGTFSIKDKILQKTIPNLGIIEDVGDWGDEYDFSPPINPEADRKITNLNPQLGIKAEVVTFETGPAKKTLRIRYNLPIPLSLNYDRTKRCPTTSDLPITILISLYPNIKRIDLEIELKNQMKDHRIRILFPTGINTEHVSVDGHFLVIDRAIKLPVGENWHQPPSKTNHQQKFISVSDGNIGMTICNKGLAEYEAFQEKGEVTLAITLLRCVGWLALPFMKSRQKEPAGPDFATPEAQCIGTHKFHLALVTHPGNYLTSSSFIQALQFNSPLKVFNPRVMRTALRVPDHIFFKGLPIYLPPDYFGETYLPRKKSFLTIQPATLLLSACKKAENEDALIVRVYNLSAQSCTGKIQLFTEIDKVKIVNLEEREIIDPQIINLQIDRNMFHFQIPGYKISTFKILLK
ncbi:MAG: alpha-mannosidase [Candidatus Helarchaeota archaeon]